MPPLPGIPRMSAAGRVAAPTADRRSRMTVALVWGAMTLLLVTLFWRDRSNIPLAEDWNMVAAFTGHEPEFATWLWSQNNEHRLPAPRIVYLSILHLTGGHFSAVGWAGVVLQSATAAGLILFLRTLRGRTDLADAFFPLQLLHWGHSAQYLFPFLISLLLPTTATLVLACMLARPQSLGRPGVAGCASGALVLLPLCGLVGLLYVPVIGIALGTLAMRRLSDSATSAGERTAAWLLVLGVAGSLVISALYFVGYYTPWWNPPNPGWLLSLKTALRVISLGFGVAPTEAWLPFIAATLLLLGGTGWWVARAMWRMPRGGRSSRWGFILFLLGAVAFAFVVGWTRSGWVPQFGIPSRYAIFTVPAFAGCFIAWVLFGSDRLRVWVPRFLALAMLALVPWNTRVGDTMFAEWYRRGVKAFHVDLGAGVPIDELARRHQPFLYHAITPEELAQRMHWLHDAGVPPFDRAHASPRP